MENQVEVKASDVVQAIRNEAERNEVFGAICYDFAHRVRTRETLTVRGLQARMEKQGGNFKREDYQHAFEFLASLHLGSLMRNTRGQVSGLKNIDVTLQSIGKASGLKVADLERFKPQKKFKQLKPVQVPTMTHKVQLKPIAQKVYTVTLIIKQGDSPIIVPGPAKLNAEELGEFLIEFSQITKKTWN